MMRPLLVIGFLATSVAALFVSGCSEDGDQTASAEDDVRTRRAAKEGELCANGVFGTPNIQCAAGLECEYPNNSTAPSGPSGSSSASTGKCVKAGAAEGELCANGVFGTPNIECAAGLECKYPNDSTAPTGPTGSSSASTGKCERAGAREGEMCANGVFGTPNIECAAGLECKYPNDSTAPTGPSGSSSASTGTCTKL